MIHFVAFALSNCTTENAGSDYGCYENGSKHLWAPPESWKRRKKSPFKRRQFIAVWDMTGKWTTSILNMVKGMWNL